MMKKGYKIRGANTGPACQRHDTRAKVSKRLLFVALIYFMLITVNCGQADGNEVFPKTYKEMALKKSELPKVVKTHPRLFIRRTPWAHGPSLDQLRKWAKSPPLSSYLKKKPWDRKPGMEWAFRYLMTDNESLVPLIVEKMKKEKGYWPGYLTTLATLYDWIYNSPNFSSKDKRLIEDKLVRWGKSAIRYGEKYQDMWSHFGYRPVTDLAAVGLALYGHRNEADDFLAYAGGYMKKSFMPAWQRNGGAWQGGWAYYSQGPAGLITLIHLWSAGTGEDLYQIIAAKQGDWLRKHLYYLLSATYDKTGPLATGGFSYSPHIKGMLQAALPIVYAYHDTNGIAAFKSLKKMPWWAGIWQFIFYPPEMHRQAKKKFTIPLSQLWGRDGAGYVQMRSGWGKGKTLIDFKCGDYFWSHQFNNQNAFTIYHGGALAIQSGLYDSYFGTHMQFYYRPTVGSNSMLILQPGETSWLPPNTAKKYGINNDKGYFPEFGGQRSCFMIPKHGSAETCFSYAKYLHRKSHQHHFETGDITAWEVGDGYTYVSGDATMAYNNPRFAYPGNRPKLDLATRDLVFLNKKYLLVFDRVHALDSSYEKRWLLHSIGEPQIATEKISRQVPGHISTYHAGLLRIDNGRGTLFVQTIFPENAKVRKVGGGPTITAVRSDPANQGNARLQTAVTGRFSAMGGTVATDAANPEAWTIEFINDNEFKISGSKTGPDGKGAIKKRLFFSKSRSLLIPKKNWQGTPRQGDRFYFKTTSASYRFWVNGQNWAPNVKKLYHVLKDGSKTQPGNWRIEVSPAGPQKFNTFLHLLTPCDRQGAKAPEVFAIQSTAGMLQGLSVANWAVLFRVRHRLDRTERYRVADNRVKRHFFLGLSPGQTYRVTNADSGKKKDMTAGPEGTILYSAGTGSFTISSLTRE